MLRLCYINRVQLRGCNQGMKQLCNCCPSFVDGLQLHPATLATSGTLPPGIPVDLAALCISRPREKLPAGPPRGVPEGPSREFAFFWRATGGPLHPPSSLALCAMGLRPGEGVSPVEPSRRRSDGDPSSPVGWRALRSEGWKWEGSRTERPLSLREGGGVGGVEGWLSPLALSI